MLRTLLFVAAVMLVRPTLADACLNGVEIQTVDHAKLVARAEKQLEAGQFASAKKSIGKGKMPTAALQQRAEDVRAVLLLRMSSKQKDLETAAQYFKTRMESKTGATDVRFKAWLGEAQLALGNKDDARTLLVALHEQDLMPDAYGYLALAKLSTGTERYNFWKACRTRSKDKDLCELPSEAKTAAKS